MASHRVATHQITACRDCGCPDLYWAGGRKGGGRYLATTAASPKPGLLNGRPWAPHRCEDYRAVQAQRASENTLLCACDARFTGTDWAAQFRTHVLTECPL